MKNKPKFQSILTKHDRKTVLKDDIYFVCMYVCAYMCKPCICGSLKTALGSWFSPPIYVGLEMNSGPQD